MWNKYGDVHRAFMMCAHGLKSLCSLLWTVSKGILIYVVFDLWENWKKWWNISLLCIDLLWVGALPSSIVYVILSIKHWCFQRVWKLGWDVKDPQNNPKGQSRVGLGQAPLASDVLGRVFKVHSFHNGYVLLLWQSGINPLNEAFWEQFQVEFSSVSIEVWGIVYAQVLTEANVFILHL